MSYYIYVVFLNFIVFSGKNNSFEIHVFRSDQFSLFNVSLFNSAVTVKMDYEENMENEKHINRDFYYRLLYGIFHITCHINPRRSY
jgi:hypothetical protein